MRIRLYFTIICCVLFQSSILFAQAPQVSFRLNEIATGATREYVARDYIRLLPGFEFTATQGNTFHARTEFGLIFPPSEGMFACPDGRLTNNPSEGGVVGAIPGHFAVSPSGAATYTIPIQVPPGINGMQPIIALVYNSQTGNGIAGWGWSIAGKSAISRTGSTLFHDGVIAPIQLNSQDNFMLDGQRLMRVAVVPYIEYRTEIETFSRIIRRWADFHVHTKDGLLLEYGISNNSRLTGLNNSTPISYLLERVTDANGNYMTFSYRKIETTGEIILYRISYGGNHNAGTPHTHHVVFHYNPERPDRQPSLIRNARIHHNHLLTGIYVKSGDEIILRYSLHYTLDKMSSRLKEVALYNGVNERINSTNITWGAGNNEFTIEQVQPSGLSSINIPQLFWYADFNGDGRMDMVTLLPESNRLAFYVSYGDGLRTTMKRWRDEIQINEPVVTLIPGDFIGNGLTDFVLVTRTEGRYRHTLFRNGNAGPFYGFIPSNIYLIRDNIALVGNFNGGGRLKLLFKGTSNTYIIDTNVTPRSIIGRYSQRITWEGSAHTSRTRRRTKLLDFNGDGRTNIMVLHNDGFRIYTMVSGNCGYSYSFQVLHSRDFPNYDTGICFADFNGDGKTDMITRDMHSGQTRVHFSTGSGFFSVPLPNMNEVPERLFIGDFTGNGRQDIAYLIPCPHVLCPHDPPRYLYLGVRFSMGMSFSDEERIPFADQGIIITVTDPDVVMIGDFNGDGRDQIIYNRFKKVIGSSMSSMSFGRNSQDRSVVSITDGMGRVVNINYTRMHNAAVYSCDNLNVIFPMSRFIANIPLVESYSKGFGNELHKTSMRYHNARVHLRGRGFLGFGRVESTDLRSGITTQTNFQVDRSSTPRRSYNVAVRSIRTRIDNEYLSSTWFENETRVREIGGRHIFFPYVTRQSTFDYLTGLGETIYFENWDNYGNPQRIINSKGGVVTTQNITYVRAGSWVPNRPSRIQTERSLHGRQHTHASVQEFVYDNAGNLIRQTASHIPAYNRFRIVTEYADHTVFGQPQRISTTADGITRTVRRTHTPCGRFIASRTNVLGQNTTYEWDKTRGLLTSVTDHWGRTTRHIHDSWGNLTGTRFPDGIHSVRALRWADIADTYVPAGSVYYSFSQTTGQAPVITWYDGLGRKIQQDTYGLNNRRVSVRTERFIQGANMGRIHRISEPFFEDDDITWAITYQDFDRYGRNIRFSTPLGETTTVFDGLTTAVTTPEGTRVTILCPAGKVARSIVNGKSVNFTYHPSGLFWMATPEGGHPVTMQYDLHGNRTLLTDPSAGVVESQYNAFGELLWSRQRIHDDNWVTTTNHFDNNGQLLRVVREGRNTKTTTYTYDSRRRLSSISIAGQHRQTFTYDEFDRIVNVREEIGGRIYNRGVEFDRYGRVAREIFPTGFYIANIYDNHSNLVEVRDSRNRLIWRPLEENARGQLLRKQKGTQITYYTFDERGLPATAFTAGIQDKRYEFNQRGNLMSRSDFAVANPQLERFWYDDLNRLHAWDIIDPANTTYNNTLAINRMYFDNLGNIISKSDLGDVRLNYGENNRPHALSSIDGMLENFPLTDLFITYTDFRKVHTIQQDDMFYEVTYGVDRQRRRSVFSINNIPQETRYYIGSYEERICHLTGITEKFHFLGGAVYIKRSDGTSDFFFIYTDYLGSLNALVREDGTVAERYAFDPWGRRRNPYNWTEFDTRTSFILNRGFTGHEHLDQFGIINMNGRIYDPFTAQFFSPDPFIQAPYNWVNFNRYTYAFGNPFRYTDPTGEIAHMILGAWIGGMMNLHANRLNIDNFWQGLGFFGIGAAAGALGAGVGAGISSVIAGGGFGAGFAGSAAAQTAATSFWNSAAISGGAGFSSGFTTGFGNGLLGGQDFSSALGSGLEMGIWGGLSGIGLGGIGGGINAMNEGRNFWHGGRLVTDVSTQLPPMTQTGSYCRYEVFRSIDTFFHGETLSVEYLRADFPNVESSVAQLREMYRSRGLIKTELGVNLDMTNTEIAQRMANFMQQGGAIHYEFIHPLHGGHAVGINRVRMWDNGRVRVNFMNPSNVGGNSTRNFNQRRHTMHQVFSIIRL